MFANSWAAFAPALDDEDDRPPPPSPTPLDFPCWNTSTNTARTPISAKDLYALFSSIQSPADVTGQHLEALNLTVLRDQDLEELVPWQRHDGSRFLPSGNDGDEEAEPGLPHKLCNDHPAPAIEVYRSRKAELVVENDSIFRAVQRLPPRPGKSPVKPGYYHKFWQNLVLMAEYWDTRNEQYFEGFESKAERRETDQEPAPKKRCYKGRRRGTGRNMPDQIREQAVKSFVEAVTWLFGCHVAMTRLPPRLALQKSFFAIRLTWAVFRTPVDRQLARQGFAEGPVMGVQCRPETCFRETGEAEGTGQAEAVDLLREAGALLFVAQDRDREGKIPTRPGEGKWYATQPRWGGGPGGEFGNAGANTDDTAAGGSTSGGSNDGDGSAPTSASSKDEKRRAPMSRSKNRKQSLADAWNKLRPGLGLWDPRVTYESIGKEVDSDFDHIFLISSLNHHASILRLKVHKSYIRFLETGRSPEDAASSAEPCPSDSQTQAGGTKQVDPSWYILELRRSRWFDLLVAADRAELMRGIWGVMSWLMRDPLLPMKNENGAPVRSETVLAARPTGSRTSMDSRAATKGERPTAAPNEEDVIMSD